MEATSPVRRYVLFRKSESRVGGVRVRRIALAGEPRGPRGALAGQARTSAPARAAAAG